MTWGVKKEPVSRRASDAERERSRKAHMLEHPEAYDPAYHNRLYTKVLAELEKERGHVNR